MTSPELLQSPVVCGSVLLILHFNSDDGLGERSSLPLFGYARGQQVGGQRRVQSVRQQDELELNLRTRQDIKGETLCRVIASRLSVGKATVIHVPG